ncbi:hypothetical protein HMPREF9062_0933 [Actinomyces sp. oral taxon 448 str. F0400]|nr:hypothetical protein HMPREF9062_0933 [Actinomyces sp. oral taxon 448 str. F0400]
MNVGCPSLISLTVNTIWFNTCMFGALMLSAIVVDACDLLAKPGIDG